MDENLSLPERATRDPNPDKERDPWYNDPAPSDPPDNVGRPWPDDTEVDVEDDDQE
jgi:hypothetical protein